MLSEFIVLLFLLFIMFSISPESSILFIIVLSFLIPIMIIFKNIKKPDIKDKPEYSKFKEKHNNSIYKTKNLITEYEEYFYKILLELENELNVRIQSQVNLASIIDKTKYNNHVYELFRNIDFGIFTKDCKKILLLIEINDQSHNNPDRIKRDNQIKDILNQANIKLITFYSNMPNEKDYIKNRIKTELEKLKTL